MPRIVAASRPQDKDTPGTPDSGAQDQSVFILPTNISLRGTGEDLSGVRANGCLGVPGECRRHFLARPALLPVIEYIMLFFFFM